MPPTPEPATNQDPLKLARIFLIVIALVALGLNLFNYARKPTPWLEALGMPLVMGGLILIAWAGLLSTAKTGTGRILRWLALVCILAGLVFEILTAFRP